MKVCSRCGKKKQLSEFYRASCSKDGHRAECKKCSKLFRRGSDKRYYEKNKQKSWDTTGLTRVCGHCGVEKPIDEFGRDRSRPMGRAYWCIICERERGRTRPARKRKSAPQKKQRVLLSEDEKKRRFADSQRRYREQNRELLRLKSKLYRLSHKKEASKRQRKYSKKMTYCSPKHRLNHRMRSLLKKTLGGQKCGRPWRKLVGYTVDDLKKHMESLFVDGMSWDNMSEWHIDHIIPIRAFNFNTPDDPDFGRCWALKNLQPLWAKDNFSKGGKLDKPFQPMLSFS